jgi:putative lipoic acid-binding regulatory protein
VSDGDGKKHTGQGTTEGQTPVIEYPTVYAFKVMGLQSEGFYDYVRLLFGRILGMEVARDSISEQASSKGKYLSLTVSVYLTSEEQRRGIYEALRKEERIVYYL